MSNPTSAPEQWTVRRLLQWSSDDFAKRNFDSPRLDSELLLADALNSTRVKLYMEMDRPLTEEELGRVRASIQRRRKNEPIAYIVGRKEFWGRDFYVDHNVLIPRPDTEVLVELALRELPKPPKKSFLPPLPPQEPDQDAAASETPATSLDIQPIENPRRSVLDLCTGSGCIAVSLTKERPAIETMATDISPGALDVAKKNAATWEVSDRIQFVLGDFLEAIPSEARFDLIVSNPPYIAKQTIAELDSTVRDFEPHLALDGGIDGLDFVRVLAKEGKRFLKPSGLILVEIGWDQGAETVRIFEQEGFADVRMEKDLGDRDRVLSARNPS